VWETTAVKVRNTLLYMLPGAGGELLDFLTTTALYKFTYLLTYLLSCSAMSDDQGTDIHCSHLGWWCQSLYGPWCVSCSVHSSPRSNASYTRLWACLLHSLPSHSQVRQLTCFWTTPMSLLFYRFHTTAPCVNMGRWTANYRIRFTMHTCQLWDSVM